MAITIQLRRDTEANFNTANTVPAAGEMLLATDTHKAVIGDGSGDDFEAMVTANKFFRFEDGDGGRVFGGNDANETITVRGGSSQTNPIFKVTTNNTSNSIVEIYDDTQLVKIDATHGATGDKTLLLKAKASQTGSVIEVQDSDSGTRFKVLEDGQTTITPNDTTDPTLDVKGSGGSQSNGILRVLNNNGSTVELAVNAGGATVAGTLGVTGETTATGGIKVDDITEATADHGIDIAKPISVTGNISASDGSKLLIQNHRGPTIITQSNTQTDFSIPNDTNDANLPSLTATKISPLSVTITPTFADSKILIEFAVYGNYSTASNSGGGDLGGTLVRSISGGATDVDLAGTNTTAGVKALFFGSGQGRSTSSAGRANSNFHGHFLDSPSTTSAVTYVFGVKGGGFDSNNDGVFSLNKSSVATGDNNLLFNFHSTIIATEIPQ